LILVAHLFVARTLDLFVSSAVPQPTIDREAGK